MKSILLILGLSLYSPYFAKTNKNELLLTACIDGVDKLHIKNGKMYWQLVQIIPPGKHPNCTTETFVNGNLWANWSKPYDLGYNTDSLITSTALVSRAISKIIQAPSKANGYETIYLFSDPGVGPSTYSISIQFFESFVPSNVNFETGSSILTEQSKYELDTLAYILKVFHKRVDIEGHTDNEGTNEANIKLSNDRAKAVFYYLKSKGVKPTTMCYIGYGNSEPLVENDSEENKAINRRVEFFMDD